MNIARLGAGGRAMSVLGGLASENIVAFADVDWARGAEGFKRWDKARDTRTSARCSTRNKNIDAVMVVTPDHMHATAALAGMQLGKHVYVEKPLTRTPWEARLLTDAAARYKVATQMGNQGYSHDATRVASEIIWSGEIGDVTRSSRLPGRASWPQGMTDAARAGGPRHARLGPVAGAARRRGPTRRATRPTGRNTTRSSSASICRSTGAASTTSAPA